MSKYNNRLMFEKSPYLLQHAHNPVDWYPWNKEAFQKARREDKPIFLSIGYSTCHWCHVMAHESFEDEDVARMMNDAFVSIKVDREERPDLDQIYMEVAQMITGGGGWPLNVIMTPDQKPFFVATYLPKESRFGRIGMMELIPKINVLWNNQRVELLNSAEKITSALQQPAHIHPEVELDKSLLDGAYKQLATIFDPANGGFGSAPKFPSPNILSFLLRYWRRTGEKAALQMVEMTLRAMSRGGIYDHLGFGFHRYSTDMRWFLPHFEKMLYDQALISMAYLETYQATGQDEYANTAKDVLTYVLRDMVSNDGGFYSAEDADSEGQEGKFYLWTKAEIEEVLDERETDLVMKAFCLQDAGNFAEDASGKRTGENVLHQSYSFDEMVNELSISEIVLKDRLEEIRKKLFSSRERRVRPAKDDKILTDWNGLMIAALARGAQALNEPMFEASAIKAANFVLKEIRSDEGRLLHRYRDDAVGIMANLDDYAFFIWGLIELYETCFQVRYLKAALELNRQLIEHFWDEDRGGFYFTPDDGDVLIQRRKESKDGALPSGNAISTYNLFRLARMTGDFQLENMATKTLQAFSAEIKGLPAAHLQFMVVLDFALGPASELVIVAPNQADNLNDMLKVFRSKFLPNKVVLFRPSDEESPEILKIAEFIRPLRPINEKATAYVCSGYVCERPTTDEGELLEKLIRGT